MPSSDEILAGLAAVSRGAAAVAIAWHAVLAAAAIALRIGWRPSRRTACAFLTAPLGSVAALAFAYGNPFNAIVFLAATVALGALAVLGPCDAVVRAPPLRAVLGTATIAYGWVYPHFVAAPPWACLYAAPVGLVPCPTLAIAIGFTLLGDGLGSRGFAATLAMFGAFYGLFGALRLGVLLDLGLVVGAAALAVAAVRGPADAPARRQRTPQPAAGPGR